MFGVLGVFGGFQVDTGRDRTMQMMEGISAPYMKKRGLRSSMVCVGTCSAQMAQMTVCCGGRGAEGSRGIQIRSLSSFTQTSNNRLPAEVSRGVQASHKPSSGRWPPVCSSPFWRQQHGPGGFQEAASDPCDVLVRGSATPAWQNKRSVPIAKGTALLGFMYAHQALA